MKKIVILVACILFASFGFAEKVDVSVAKTVAETFYQSVANQSQKSSSVSMNLAYECKSDMSGQKSVKEEIAYYYVFNASDNKGFVIISGDDKVSPVLGYSTNNSFDATHIPDNVKKWLDGYRSEISYAIQEGISASDEISEEWSALKSGIPIAYQKSTTAVSPLLSTTWDQSPYYNALCPYDNTEGALTVTGCVATAMAQIMKYWNYPTKGSGYRSYVHDQYGTLSANFAATTYNWSAMPNNVSSSNTAVATLMYHCGVSVDMDYGTASQGGSGAYTFLDDAYIQYGYIDARTALKTYFGYTNVVGYNRDDFALATWISKLKTELDAGRPILYAGSGTGGGHAFVCDGYDNTDKFHMNWGWSGYYDGYFVITALNPSGTGTGGGSGGFNSNQRALLDIKPPVIDDTSDIRLYAALSLSSSSIYYGQSFTLSTSIGNYGSTSFTGDYCLAVFDEDVNFVTNIDTISTTLASGYYEAVQFSTDGLLQLIPGDYYLVVIYRLAGGNWMLVGDGSFVNTKQLTVYNSADIEMYSDFNITPSASQIYQGGSISVNCDVLNDGSIDFSGTLYLCFYDMETGQLALLIDQETITDLPPNYHYIDGIDFSNNDLEIEPGSYLLALMYQPSASSSAYLAGSTYKQNPIVVVVKAAPLQADAYEPNNDHQSAANLSLSFSGDKASVQTTGATLHSGTTKDYYKLTLPPDYDYAIMAEVFDAYNFPKGQSYTCDVLFSYFSAATDWSDAFDDEMDDTLFVENGGTVYFFVSPFSEGSTGTYLLDVYVRRISKAGISEMENALLMKIYPNPVSERFTIDNGKEIMKEMRLYDVVGKEVKRYEINDTNTEVNISDLPSGIYLLQVQTESTRITKRIVKD